MYSKYKTQMITAQIKKTPKLINPKKTGPVKYAKPQKKSKLFISPLLYFQDHGSTNPNKLQLVKQ